MIDNKGDNSESTDLLTRLTIYCVDKEFECSMLLPDIMPMLPDNFYFVRRGCVINTMYVTSIRRCEVELIFGTTIQIPVPSYTKVKKDINALVMCNNIICPNHYEYFPNH